MLPTEIDPLLDRIRRAKERTTMRHALRGMRRERRLAIERATENILIEEAEEAARLTRWRRRQLEALG